MRAKMAIPSLSYDPATEREIYPGTMAIKPAAKSPAPCDHSSFVKRYVEIAVSPLKRGAKNTHMSRMLVGMFKSEST